MTAIHIKGLTKTYNNGVQALKGIDLQIQKGDFFALLGPNGAGKSTTIGIISSLVRPSSGAVEVFGLDTRDEPHKTKQLIGVVPQEFNFNVFETPLQIICYQAGYYGVPYATAKARAERLLKDLDIWDKRHQPSRSLSGGQKRRLMIARALVHEPKLLILDEPTAGVDIALRRQMWDILQQWNQDGLTIILTTHYLEEAEYLCSKIAIIDHGTVIANTHKDTLLDTLKSEILVCSTQTPYSLTSELDDLQIRRVDDLTFEVCIHSQLSVHDLLTRLKSAGILVHRLKNKSNRLEELFVNMVDTL